MPATACTATLALAPSLIIIDSPGDGTKSVQRRTRFLANLTPPQAVSLLKP